MVEPLAPDSSLTIEPRPGLGIHVEHFVPQLVTPRAWVVLVHGFSMFTRTLWPLARALADAGLAAIVFDCRGHGRSSGPRGHVQRFGDYLDDLSAVIEHARATFPARPWLLMGHSHGATIALMFALRADRPRPLGLLLAAPLLGLSLTVPRWKRWLARPLSALWPTLPLPNGLVPEIATKNSVAARRFFDEPLIHHVATPRWFRELERALAWIVERPTELRVPTYLMLAADDQVVDNSVVRVFAGHAGPQVQVRTWAGLRHLMFWEPERSIVIGDAIRWIDAALAKFNSER